MKEKISKETIIRTAVLILALVNSALALFGKSPLPFDSDEVTEVISYLFTAGAALVAWWYNNSFTQKAIKADLTFKSRNKSKDEYIERI
jgi:SPP1 family holin